LIEQGLTSHQTHYRSYWGRPFTGIPQNWFNFTFTITVTH